MRTMRMLDWREVTVTDPFVCRSLELEINYLLSLDVDRLLAGFRRTAGIPSAAERYGGWESTEIQGHTMGHWLSAMAQAWAATADERIMARLRTAVDGLLACQREDGFLFASPEELFDRVENRRPVWVPWYTMHKIIAGLVCVCRMTAYPPAMTVLRRLADWVAGRVLDWSEDTMRTVLAVEYGGMNDCLYDTYALTGDERHLRAAECFDELPLFDALSEGKDILDGLHANTTIPKILGGLKGYAVTGGKYPERLRMAENFFDIVTRHHTYLSGGNSEWERFGKPDILDAERTACNCETCNTHNMIALAQLLFSLTGKAKYAGYDAWAYVNTILSSQNHETGMTTYFQPMDTGYFKVYSRPYDQFWCCTGTGMENFTKPWAGTAYIDDNTLYISRLVSAHITAENTDITLAADWLNHSSVSLCVNALPEDITLALRLPHWCAEYTADLPGGICLREENGFLYLSGRWGADNKATLRLDAELCCHGLPDSSNTVAYSYGPFMLSADMGSECMRTDVTGVDVTVPTRDITVSDHLVDPTVVPTGNPCEFIVHSADGRKLTFAPHFLKNQIRYGIYFRRFAKDSEELQAYLAEVSRRQAVLLGQYDVIPLGNDQYELAHHVRGEKTDSFTDETGQGRVIRPGGSVSYTLDLPDIPCLIRLRYSGEAYVVLDGDPLPLSEAMAVPESLCSKQVRITIANPSPAAELRLFDELYITGRE